MIFDLLNTPLNFSSNEESHSIKIYCESINEDILSYRASIDDVKLTDVNIAWDLMNSKYLLSDEIFIINGINENGINCQYHLTMSHSFDENGIDYYTPIEFFQAF
jgi:hypothetical protein